MTASDVPRGGTDPQRDAIQGLAEIVSRGHAAVTVLINEIHGGVGVPIDVRPQADESTVAWAEQIADALGEARGRVVGLTAERPGLAARLALGLAGRLVDMGAPVTVVDGSIEEPVFSKGLPEDGDEGLVDAVLFGVSSSTVARRTLMHGVRLVTAGSYPISVPAVLGAEAYRTTLQKLAREDATVLLVLPSSYASVAAGAASQLIIVERDLPALERVARNLRSAEDLRDVRFVAVLSASEPVPVVEGPAEDVPEPEVAEQDVPAEETPPSPGETVVEETATADETIVAGEEVTPDAMTGATDDEIPADGAPDDSAFVIDATSDGGVTREPAVVTASTASVPPSRLATDDESRREGERPAGRRWGGLITVIVILLLAGVAWRTGVLDRVFGSDDGESVTADLTEDTGLTEGTGLTGDAEPSETTDVALGDTTALSTEGIEESVAPDDLVGSADAGDHEEPLDTEARPRDWRELAISEAVPGRYVVFTSSHRLTSAADRDARTLERNGFPARVVAVDIPERGTWHRVAVDAGFRTLDDTRELLDIMKEVGYEGAWIERLRVPAPPAVEPPAVAPPDTTDRWIDEGSAPQ